MGMLETQQQPSIVHQPPMMQSCSPYPPTPTSYPEWPMMQAGGEMNYLEREARELSQQQHTSYPSSSNSGQNVCKDFLAGKCNRAQCKFVHDASYRIPGGVKRIRTE